MYRRFSFLLLCLGGFFVLGTSGSVYDHVMDEARPQVLGEDEGAKNHSNTPTHQPEEDREKASVELEIETGYFPESLSKIYYTYDYSNGISGELPENIVEPISTSESFRSSSVMCDRERDSLALVAFYNATNGPGWANSDGWLTSAPLEEWLGVTTDEGCVIILNLDNNQISGEIPSGIGNLLSLATLSLSGNSIRGCIPIEVGGLRELSSLFLDHNQLTGNIPAELGQLINISRLRLDENRLEGDIPAELGQLINVYEFNLFSNRLTGEIPKELGNFTNVGFFRLGNNQLSGVIPPELGQISTQLFFDLGNNRLSGSIPSELAHIGRASIASLRGNLLSGCIPESIIDDCPSNFDFDNNPLLPYSGDFSRICNGEPQIGAPCNDNNPETENDIIDADCNCTGEPIAGACDRTRDSLALVALYNSTNGPGWTNPSGWLTNAPLEEWFGVTTDGACVTQLRLNNNSLSGAIPSELGGLSNLELLFLDRNELSGAIPSELGSLSNLEILYLSRNELSGAIPSELGSLSNLTQLFLDRNELSGAIPSELGSLSNLTQLFLDRNELSGTIPSELGGLSNLTELYLSRNELSGAIPSELGGLSNLTEIYLHDNLLEGCFPGELMVQCALNPGDTARFFIGYSFLNNPALPYQGDFERICNGEPQIGAPCDDGNPETESDVIDADCNCRGQPIASTCDRVRDSLALVALYNSTNGPGWTNPTGWLTDAPIEDWFGVRTNGICVTHLLLDENGVNGPIPAELGQILNIEVLRLGINSLYGPIPPELGRLIKLRDLSLHRNSLTGLIPSDLGELVNLETLQLHSNRLEGIPLEINRLFNLEWLTISANRLSGIIPPGIGQADNLRVLRLNNNLLTGEIPADLGDLSNLEILSIGTNQLSGSIPPELGQLISLERFFLAGNLLTGAIPLELGQLENVLYFSLDRNLLSGEIPAELGQLENLIGFNLSSNNLEGCFPEGLLSLCSLTSGQGGGGLAPGYHFLDNPLLPYQGDFERICNGEPQIGAPCNDGNPETENDIIDDDCNCNGQLLLDNELETYAPSGFTPNNDGTNDLFIIPALDPDPEVFDDNELTVFNRWGQIVYHAKPYRNDWNGTHYRTNIDLPVGTYFFTLKLDIGNGMLEDGHVTIIR